MSKIIFIGKVNMSLVNINVYPPLDARAGGSGGSKKPVKSDNKNELAARRTPLVPGTGGAGGNVGASGRVTGAVGAVDPATGVSQNVGAGPAAGYVRRNIEDWPLCGIDCFEGGCLEAQLRCSNRVLPGSAIYDPCIGRCVNKYNYFPYTYVVSGGRGRGRRGWW